MFKLDGNFRVLSAALGAAAVGLAADLPAEELSYEMSSYAQRPGGKELLEGDYPAAIAAALRGGRSRDILESVVANTNLCVAYTVTERFAEADDACDRAVTVAKRVDARPFSRFRRNAETAKALSNRGVLRALTGDTINAEYDFRKAGTMSSAMSSDASAPSRNLLRLEASPAYRLATAQASD